MKSVTADAPAYVKVMNSVCVHLCWSAFQNFIWSLKYTDIHLVLRTAAFARLKFSTKLPDKGIACKCLKVRDWLCHSQNHNHYKHTYYANDTVKLSSSTIDKSKQSYTQRDCSHSCCICADTFRRFAAVLKR